MKCLCFSLFTPVFPLNKVLIAPLSLVIPKTWKTNAGKPRTSRMCDGRKDALQAPPRRTPAVRLQLRELGGTVGGGGDGVDECGAEPRLFELVDPGDGGAAWAAHIVLEFPGVKS